MLQDSLYYSEGERKKKTPPPQKKEKKKNPHEQTIIAKIFLSKTQYSKGTTALYLMSRMRQAMAYPSDMTPH